MRRALEKTATTLALAGLCFVGAARAGVPIRNEEGRPASAVDEYRRPKGFVPEGAQGVWSRFVDAFAASRGRVARPAVLERDHELPEGDLGDGFLVGFARDRRLRHKLDCLSSYLATLGRARRWLEGADEGLRQNLSENFRAFAREASRAQGILISQLGRDIERGGRSLEVVLDHVERSGFADHAAQDAFGGLSRGLRQTFTRLVQSGAVDATRKDELTQELEILARIVAGE